MEYFWELVKKEYIEIRYSWKQLLWYGFLFALFFYFAAELKNNAPVTQFNNVYYVITIFFSSFAPGNFLSDSIFSDNVVAYVEGMDFSIAIPNLFNLNTRFVSDVVFVRQDGTDIWFRTDDNAISQNMRINVRSVLTSGQKIRLYYRVTKAQYRLPVWQVIAIERL